MCVSVCICADMCVSVYLCVSVCIQADNPDTGELWRGYILTVAKVSSTPPTNHTPLTYISTVSTRSPDTSVCAVCVCVCDVCLQLEVPHQLQLLPGHFMALEHVRDQEQQRQVLPPFYQPSMDVPAPRSCTPTSSEASNEYDDSLSSVPT